MNKALKVAVIEDDLPIRQLYELKLKREGFLVKSAVNGSEGLELIKQFRPELILLDLNMPVMGGHDMLIELRKFDWSSSIYVVILTNLSKDEAPSALRFLGVDRYIVKAYYTPNQIVGVVQELLAR